MTELEIKAAVRARDGCCCTLCGMTGADHIRLYGFILDVHRNVPGSEYTIEGCVTVCRACHGPLSRLPRGERIRRLGEAGLPVPVKIDEDVYRLVKTASSWKGVSIAEYLSAVVKPVAQRDCARIGKQASSLEEAE